MKILALVLALAGVARADELSDLHDDYARSQRRVSIALLSGGLASIEDIKALLAPSTRKIAGAIAGRALYDGRLDAAAALALTRAARGT